MKPYDDKLMGIMGHDLDNAAQAFGTLQILLCPPASPDSVAKAQQVVNEALRKLYQGELAHLNVLIENCTEEEALETLQSFREELEDKMKWESP